MLAKANVVGLDHSPAATFHQLWLTSPAQEQPWVVHSSPIKQEMEEGREKIDQQLRKQRSLDLLTRKTLTYGCPGLTGHYDERQTAEQHLLGKNSCLSAKSHPEVTSGQSAPPKYTHRSRRHHPDSFGVI